MCAVAFFKNHKSEMRAILSARTLRAQPLSRRLVNFIAAVLCAALALPAGAQERFSVFVPSDEDDVKRMLKLAGLRDGDVVYDLGSGDGRIVFEAVKQNPKVSGRGIEIDEKLVAESRQTAKKLGVADRVQFLHQNAFDSDLKDATIIAMWLWPEVMRMLRPKILREARPGTRVVTRVWDLGTWKPDTTDTEGSNVYVWVVPAKVAPYWTWTLTIENARHTYAAALEQHFQSVEGVVRVGHRRGVFESMKLSGDEITFTLAMTLDGLGLARHQFRGRVKGGVIEGNVTVTSENGATVVELPWRAERVADSTYFAPTGLDFK